MPLFHIIRRMSVVIRIASIVMLLLVATATSLYGQERTLLPDSTGLAYRHTDAVRTMVVHRDTARAETLWQEIITADTSYAPALYHLSTISRSREQGLDYARRAYMADSTNKWYTANYARRLIDSRNYREAIHIYQHMMRLAPRDIETYHALSLLYNAMGMPYSAISVLDSAELRMGRHPYLSAIKQGLLLETRQYDRAIEAGEEYIEEYPYDIDARVTLAAAYDAAGRDSLATAALERAHRMDTTHLSTLYALVDYYDRRNDSRRMLEYEARIMRDERVPLSEKIERMEHHISDFKFYSENYLTLGNIIQGLAIEYPNDRRVVNIYAEHIIAMGNGEYAVDYLRRHLDDEGTSAKDYIMLLELECYLDKQELLKEDRERALKLFSTDVEMLSYIGFMHNEEGDRELAIETFKHGLKQTKTDIERSKLWGYMGDIYHAAKDNKRAFKAYNKALDYDENNTLVMNNYAYALALCDKDLEYALKLSARTIEQEDGNATYLDTYAWVLHRLGRNDEAKRIMQQALSIDGQRTATLLAHYGDILWALGENFMARTYWQKAVERGYDSQEMDAHIEEITNTIKR